MKKNGSAVKKGINFFVLILIVSSIFTACEQDFSEVGSDLVNKNNFNALLFKNTEIDAFSVKVNRVQTNNSNVFLLGTYSDEVYGNTTASIISQLNLVTTNPSFGNNPVVDSVVFSIPYFSTAIDRNGEKTIYRLDSLYGNEPINLSIHRSNYYLRSLDPSDNYNQQVYYSDQGDIFEQNIETSALYANENFVPSAEETITTTFIKDEEGEPTDEVQVTRSGPAFRALLSKEYFTDLIIDQEGTSNLKSNSDFQDYFRGLYFKVNSKTGEGNMSLLDFNKASITLHYTYDYTVNTKTEDGETKVEKRKGQKEFVLSFGPNRVNVFKNEFNNLPEDEKLYLKGGEGSMAVIDLFTNEVQLDSIRERGWLVNEANLKFYVDESAPSKQKQPKRLFIYDLNNNRVLSDYTLDASANQNNPLASRLIHLGPLSEDDKGNSFYKIRVTGLVSDIINRDSTSTRLGLSVSNNVNSTSLSKADFSPAVENLENQPNSSTFYPKGTVLHGINPSEENISKKLQLEIYYTEPK